MLKNAVCGVIVGLAVVGSAEAGTVVEERKLWTRGLCELGVVAELGRRGKPYQTEKTKGHTDFLTPADAGDPRGDTVRLRCFSGGRLIVEIQP